MEIKNTEQLLHELNSDIKALTARVNYISMVTDQICALVFLSKFWKGMGGVDRALVSKAMEAIALGKRERDIERNLYRKYFDEKRR